MKFLSYKKTISLTMTKSVARILTAPAILVFFAVFQSCSMVNEDLDPCAPPPKAITNVNFVYDYNMQDEDLFFEHVGSVYLYVFNEDGIYIERREKHKDDFKAGDDFSMSFSEEELVPGETYNFVAVAQGNGAGANVSDDYQWYKLVNPMVLGVSKIEDYILRLDRDTNNDGFSEVGIINYKDQYGQNQQMIDTLWTTKPDQVQTIMIQKPEYIPSPTPHPDVVTDVQIPMMRITNSITVNLLYPYFDLNTDPNDYHVVIHFPNGNGTVDFTGGLDNSIHELYYQSLIKRMAEYKPKNYSSRGDEDSDIDPNKKYTMKSLFGVSRLMVNDESSLQLRDATKEGYPIIYELPNFSEVLAQMLNESEWGDQEFLDREYDFTIDINLDDKGNVTWVGFSISILSWGRRIYYYDLT